VREREIYIEHYLTTYSDPPIPPCWVLAECLSLGVWSQIYDKLANRDGPVRISRVFCLPPTALGSWMHALSVTRNICAHHGRVWNRNFVFKPAVLAGYEEHFAYHPRFYTQAVAAAYLLRRIEPSTKWHLRMKDTLLSCPPSEAASLGVVASWDTKDIWAEAALPPHVVKTLAPKK
jgi:abortive infection bacteriophage resistance protein